jgi:hypothetical protein
VSLDKWPYPFLDLFTYNANMIFFVIVILCYVTMGVLYLVVGVVEDKFGAGWKMKGMPPSRKQPHREGKMKTK